MSNNVVGRWSSFAAFLVGAAYIVALVIGFTTRGLSVPIVDPLLAIMEMLTLIAAFLMLEQMRRTWTIIGVGDVAGSFKWYQSLLGLPRRLPRR